MKALGLTLGMILSAAVSLAAGSKHNCKGIIQYDANTSQRVKVALDTQEMTIGILTEDGRASKFLVTTSSRSNSYMRGMQFIEAARESGDHADFMKIEFPWTYYYGDEIRMFLYVPGGSGMAVLSCDKNVYDGPANYKR